VQFTGINYVAVLVATIASFVLGGLWYSPMLFGRTWLAGIRKREDELGSPAPALAINFAAALVTAIVMAALVNGLNLRTAGEGLTLGLAIGVGIVAASMASDFAFNRFPQSLFFVEAGYRVLLTVIMGVVLAVWR
jgi:hypothetical protein